MPALITASDLALFRADAEALMVDTFEVGTPGEWTYNEGTGLTTRALTVEFTSIGRLVTSTAASESEAGERTVVAISRTLHLPVSTPAVATNKVARRVFDGAEFRVLADVSHSHPKSRRLAVEQVLS